MDFFQHEQALVSPKSKIGKGTRIWAFTNIQDGAVVGKECNICDGCFVEKGAVIGDNVTIKNRVAIFEGVTLEDDVFCGTNVTFINDRNPRSNREASWNLEKTVVEKGASIGSNATVLCGIALGEYSVIGAGSVVTKDVPPYVIVVGNPARKIGFACSCGLKLNESFSCSCGLKYEETIDGLILKS